MPASITTEFIDTNVLIYLLSGDTAKATRAEQILAAGGVISVQVLNEIANICRRKLRLSWPDTQSMLQTARAFLTVQPLTTENHEAGLLLAERHRLSIYDAMIVASALHAGCDTLWSEDMQHGMVIETHLTIANPFRT